MELNFPHIKRFELEAVLREFYAKDAPECSILSFAGNSSAVSESPSLFTVELSETLTSLQIPDLPRSFANELYTISVLLFASDFSTDHLLFHYDGTSHSTEAIKNFVTFFSSLIQDSKATIISPSFIPKSKIHEEQEIIELVVSSTKETSFIKLNFAKIADFWSYGVDHKCTLLVTTNNYHKDLAKTLFQYRKANTGDRISVILLVAPANVEKMKYP